MNQKLVGGFSTNHLQKYESNWIISTIFGMKTKKNGNHTPKKRCQPPDARRGLADVVQLLSRSANPNKSHRPTPAAEIGGNWWWEETGFHTKIRWQRIVWSCKLTTLKSFVKDWIPKKNSGNKWYHSYYIFVTFEKMKQNAISPCWKQISLNSARELMARTFFGKIFLGSMSDGGNLFQAVTKSSCFLDGCLVRPSGLAKKYVNAMNNQILTKKQLVDGVNPFVLLPKLDHLPR